MGLENSNRKRFDFQYNAIDMSENYLEDSKHQETFWSTKEYLQEKKMEWLDFTLTFKTFLL